MNIEVSSNNDAIEKRWQKFYIKTMIQVLVFTFFVEIGMYFFLDKFNLIGTTTSTYIIRYLVNPTVNNIIILLVFIGTSKLFKSIYVKTYLLLTGFVLMLLNIALVHNYFMVTLLIFCVPSFTSVFFQKKRYVYYSMTLSVLSICVVYCQVKWGYAKSWADSKYMASAVVTILIVIICSVIASRIAGVLEAQTKRMKELTMQALEANETKSKFLSIATHELRTPLNAISGMVDMMRRDGANPGQEKYLRSIKFETKR